VRRTLADGVFVALAIPAVAGLALAVLVLMLATLVLAAASVLLVPALIVGKIVGGLRWRPGETLEARWERMAERDQARRFQ
jgi:hypothetical protein